VAVWIQLLTPDRTEKQRIPPRQTSAVFAVRSTSMGRAEHVSGDFTEEA
jgi:hypothetical protein